jgi:protein ImuA
MATAQDASPAVLRLALRPETDGLAVDILKRRGPVAAEPLCVTLQPGPVLYPARRRAPRPVLVPVGVPAGEVAVET